MYNKERCATAYMPNDEELNRIRLISVREHHAVRKKLYLISKWGGEKNVIPEAYQKASVVFLMIYFLSWVMGIGYL